MKKIVRVSVVGIIISSCLIFFKDSFYSKLAASLALIVFLCMFYFNYKGEKTHTNKH